MQNEEPDIIRRSFGVIHALHTYST